jgi:hypothetical protein
MADSKNMIPRALFYITRRRYHLVGLMPMTSSKMKFSLKMLKTGIRWQPRRLVLEELGLKL